MFESSESIDQLSTALAKAQKVMGSAAKDKENPFFKSKYADLSSVIFAVKDALSDNGLSYTQFPIREDNAAGVITVLMHSSGQWVRSFYTLPLSKFDAQSVGSCVTYARRYALQAICGIPADDDDGNKATEASPPSPLEAHLEALKRNKASVDCIKQAIADEAWETAAEAWAELTDDDKVALYGIAPSKGGKAFTTSERAALKSNEFYAARKAMFGG